MIVKVKALIFDMDGVITDTMPYHYRAWALVFLRQGIRVTRADIYKREGQKGIDSVREVFLEYGRPFSEALAREILQEKELLFKDIFKQKFISGSRRFIKCLKQEGFSLGLVTGTSRPEAQKLLPVDLFNMFDVTVCGCDVQNGKPHPEPYQKAIRQLKVKVSQAIVLENAPFGIRSAKAAGLKCFALATSLPKPFLTHADMVFPSYKAMLDKVVFKRLP